MNAWTSCGVLGRLLPPEYPFLAPGRVATVGVGRGLGAGRMKPGGAAGAIPGGGLKRGAGGAIPGGGVGRARRFFFFFGGASAFGILGSRGLSGAPAGADIFLILTNLLRLKKADFYLELAFIGQLEIRHFPVAFDQSGFDIAVVELLICGYFQIGSAAVTVEQQVAVI